MENNRADEGRKVSLRLKPVYTLDRDKRIGAEIDNVNMYLYKNGKMSDCPFRLVAVQQGAGQQGLVALPCGEDCPHFHFAPETKKVPVKPKDGEESKGETAMEVVETGKIFARLTCGCGGMNGMGTYLPIANINAGGDKSEQPASKIISIHQK